MQILSFQELKKVSLHVGVWGKNGATVQTGKVNDLGPIHCNLIEKYVIFTI